MDLWIRSQDKNYLMRAGVLALRDIKGTIISNTVSDNCYIIGEYKTKERALEVLDEIQSFLTITYQKNDCTYEYADLILKGKIIEGMIKIYTMPKE